jgi:peptidoglycan/LPS O-acetylase OafA/YrhL
LRASQGTLVGLLALACGAEFLLQQVIRGVWPLAAGSMLLLGPPYRYIEFLVGALIAALLLSGMSISARIRPAALFVALVYLIASTHDVWIRNSDVNAAMMLPFAALIATTAASGLQRRASLERRWLVGRGNASFALYLVHYPIVLAVARLAHDQPFAARLLLALAALGLSLVTAEVAHALFEKPVERALRAQGD